MARIQIIDRADMKAEQSRVYDAAKNLGGVVGGPYYAYIRLPKLFEACQNLRDCLSSGPLSPREQQIVILTSLGTRRLDTHGLRKYAAHSRWVSIRRSSMRSMRESLLLS